MYQAIVLLPLLGAIIAGLIALVGARRRHPGGEPGTHEHAHETRYGIHIHDDDNDDHAAAEGSQAAEIITSGLLVVAAVLSWIAFFSVAFATPEEDLPQHIRLFSWFASQTLEVDWAIRVDTLTVVMLVVVTTVSSLVHIYSIGYMVHDPYRPRFFAYLSMFTFAMLALVTADNLVQLFFGWEGVGLASYLLIGFWWQRPAANAAAIKAFIVNRVGDFGFALGIFGIFVLFNSVEYDTIFANAPTIVGKTMHFLSWDFDALTVLCLLLFMGAMGKSAQFLLHTWLPDAMEGPTPVSALIHAATMVTAGVFMVARLSPIFALSPTALAVVMFFGATTAFFAATVGLVQNDIKRVVAYSTCSQLGYMFVAMGAGAYGAGMFHLFTHAFFKALLFLGAGSVIHAVGGEQDMRNMGGLRKHIPITYWMMVIGTLALTGFPFTAGYFSKDAIIEAAYGAVSNPVAMYAWVLTVAAALMTAFYSWRLIFLTFHGEARASHRVMEHVHESPQVMLVPLHVLATGALLGGAVFFTFFIGSGAEAFWKGAVFLPHEEHHEAVPLLVAALPTLMMASGAALAAWFYLYDPRVPRELAERNDWLYKFLLNKWYFDELYDFLFVRPTLWLGRFLWKRGDGWLIDGFGPDAVSARVLDVTQRVVRLQSGYLYHYAFAMLIGVAILVTWLMFHGVGTGTMFDWPILSLITFLPSVGALIVLIIRGDDAAARRNMFQVSIWTTVLTFVISLFIWIAFDNTEAGFQFVEETPWLGGAIRYKMGVDGISMLFVILTTFLMPLCILASKLTVSRYYKAYMVAFLTLETLMIGVFCALDLVLFYVFFEGGLIPMFLIIGIWGGPRRVYASFKFFLYTLTGSLLMLLAIMAMYWQAGTSDIPTLLTHAFPAEMQLWLWIAFFASFAVKLPMWPVHTWLPDAHVEAPTAGSVILAAILLKMGGYGFLRFSLPMFPIASADLAPFVFTLSVFAIVYTSFVALAQEDLKKLIAYSSVAHMGFVTMGLFAANAQGIQGGIFQMLSHGIISAALFLCVGVVYDRMHTREIAAYGGLVQRMPLYAAVFMVFTLGNVGLPGTTGFVGEFLALAGAFKVNTWVAFIAATGMVLSAAYMLWVYRRVIFGVIEKDSLRSILDLSVREVAIFAPLVALAIFFGFYPGPILSVTSASVEQLITNYNAALSTAGSLALK